MSEDYKFTGIYRWPHLWCGVQSLVTQLKMAVQNLIPCWYHKIGQVKKEENFYMGKNALEN